MHIFGNMMKSLSDTLQNKQQKIKLIIKQFYKENGNHYKRPFSPLKDLTPVVINPFKNRSKNKNSLINEVQKLIDFDVNKLNDKIDKVDFISYEKYQ